MGIEKLINFQKLQHQRLEFNKFSILGSIRRKKYKNTKQWPCYLSLRENKQQKLRRTYLWWGRMDSRQINFKLRFDSITGWLLCLSKFQNFKHFIKEHIKKKIKQKYRFKYLRIKQVKLRGHEFIQFRNHKRSWIRTVWNSKTCKRPKYATSLCFKTNFKKFSKKIRLIGLYWRVKKNSSKNIISFYCRFCKGFFRWPKCLLLDVIY